MNQLPEQFDRDLDILRANQTGLRDYIELIRKGWLWLLLATILAGIGSAIYVQRQVPEYEASATLLIQPQRSNIVSVEELIGVETQNKDYYQTQFELLRSRSLAYRVIDALDLWEHHELASTTAEPTTAQTTTTSEQLSDADAEIIEADTASTADEQSGMLGRASTAVATAYQSIVGGDVENVNPPADNASPTVEQDGDAIDYISTSMSAEQRQSALQKQRKVSRFLKRLTILPVRDTKLVELRYRSSDPVLAADVADMVGEQYITSYLDSKLKRTEKAATWLGSRVAELGRTLAESEQRLLQFKRENELVDVAGNVGRLNEQELLMASAELAEARLAVQQTGGLLRQISSFDGELDLLLSIPQIQSDPLVQGTKVEQAQVELEISELQNRYGPKHPSVRDAQSRLDAIETKLDSNVERAISAIESEHAANQGRYSSVSQKLVTDKEEIQLLGEKRFQLEALEREVATNLQVYQTFYSRMTEARSADGLDVANASLSDRAVPPENPVSPAKIPTITLSVIAAFLLSYLILWVREHLDGSLNEPRDVEAVLGMPLIGMTPRLSHNWFSRRRSLPLSPDSVKNGAYVEAVNAIRTTIGLNSEEHCKRVILVTSTIPGEGKSSLAVNLATSFGRVQKTLLIEGDLRYPGITRLYRRKSYSGGLSSVITDIKKLNQSIIRDELGTNVDLLPCGPIPPHPLELLSSKDFEIIMRMLRQRYGRIIIDSPPVRAVSDAMVLSCHSDSVIYVVRAHKTHMEAVSRGIAKLESVNAPLAGIVLSQVSARRTRRYVGEKYYSKYHDFPVSAESIATRSATGGLYSHGNRTPRRRAATGKAVAEARSSGEKKLRELDEAELDDLK